MAKPRSSTKKTSKVAGKRRSGPGSASKKVDTRERMHRLAQTAFADGHVDLDRLRDTTTATFASVRSAVARAMPEERDNILRQTFDGLASAVASGTESAWRAMDRAKAAGRRISREEWATFASQMKSLERNFLESVSDAAHGMTDEARGTLDEIVRRARKAGTDIGPAAAKAASTAAKHAPELATETVKAGGRAAAAMASEFAMGVSGLLSGLGSALAAKSTRRPMAKSTTVAKKSPTKAAKKPTAKAKKPRPATKAARRKG